MYAIRLFNDAAALKEFGNRYSEGYKPTPAEALTYAAKIAAKYGERVAICCNARNFVEVKPNGQILARPWTEFYFGKPSKEYEELMAAAEAKCQICYDPGCNPVGAYGGWCCPKMLGLSPTRTQVKVATGAIRCGSFGFRVQRKHPKKKFTHPLLYI